MAKASQLWKAVGITRHATIGGEDRIRFGAEFVSIVKRFSKGADRCDYIELPEPMSKTDALEHMKQAPEFANPVDQALIQEKAAKYRPRGVRVTMSLDAIRERARKNSVTAEDVLRAIAE